MVVSLNNRWCRRGKYTVFLASGAFLAATLVMFVQAQRTRAEQAARSEQLATTLNNTRQQLQLFRQKVKRASEASQLILQTRRTGLIESHWSSNELHVTRQNLDRGSTNRLLESLSGNARRVLKLDHFDVAVTNRDQGLFTPPDTRVRDYPLQVTMTGQVYFLTRDAGGY